MKSDDEDDDEWFLDMGVPQKLNDADLQDFYDVYSDAVIHLLSVASNEDLSHMIPHCKNKHAMCTQWAIAGSCHNNGVHNEYFMDTE